MDQKVALVTGASRGIGQAIAKKLAEQGYIIIGTATTLAGAHQISENLKQAGYPGEGMLLNLTETTLIEDLLTQIQEKYGNISILVNNAGITRDNLMLRMKPEEWDTVLHTNLRAIYQLSKAVLKGMLKQRFGRIINISSIVGVTGNAGQANYAAAKAGMIGFSKSLAMEVASRNITVNVVAPGFIDTDMTRALNSEQHDAIIQKIPMQKLGQPEDIANAVAFLASDAANYITGQTLHVNGGMYMN